MVMNGAPQGDRFFASAIQDKGRKIASHADPMVETYSIVIVEGDMTVGDDTRHVFPGEGAGIPAGATPALENIKENILFLMVAASSNRQDNSNFFLDEPHLFIG